MELKIGISGKRYIEPSETERVKEEIRRYIKETLENAGQTTFIGLSSIAEGADSLFAEIVIKEFKQPLHVVLPFAADVYRDDFSGVKLEHFNHLLELAEKVEVVTKETPATIQIRNHGYFKAGIYIADNSGNMVFVMDHAKPAGEGGTADVMGYVQIEKTSLNYKEIFVKSKHPDALFDRICNEFKHSNNEAIVNRDRHSVTWKYSLLMGWIAVTLVAIKSGFNIEGEVGLTLITLEFFLVTATMILVFRANRKKFHGSYLAHRVRAEQLRLLKVYYLADKPVTIPFLTHQQDKELKSIIDEVNQAAAAEHYKSKWFANYKISELIGEQINYHKRKIFDIGQLPKRYEMINRVIGGVFYANLFFHFLLSWLHKDETQNTHAGIVENLGLFLGVALPASFAAIEGMLHFQDWEVIKKHAEFAEANLKTALEKMPKDLNVTNDVIIDQMQLDVLNFASTIMLDDNKKWQIVLEEKTNYHWV